MEASVEVLGTEIATADAANAIRSKNFLLLGHGPIETLKRQFVNGNFSQLLFLDPNSEGSRERSRLEANQCNV